MKTTLPLAFRTVYCSNPLLYALVSVFVFSSLWILFNVMDQLLFFSPVLFFYVPNDAMVGFVFTNVIAFLLGIVVSMNVYVIRYSRLRLDKSLFSGSFLGITSGVCASLFVNRIPHNICLWGSRNSCHRISYQLSNTLAITFDFYNGLGIIFST